MKSKNIFASCTYRFISWQFVEGSVKEGSEDLNNLVVATSIMLNFKRIHKIFSCTKWPCQPYGYHLIEENSFAVRTYITILPNVECYLMWPSGFAECHETMLFSSDFSALRPATGKNMYLVICQPLVLGGLSHLSVLPAVVTLCLLAVFHVAMCSKVRAGECVCVCSVCVCGVCVCVLR